MGGQDGTEGGPGAPGWLFVEVLDGTEEVRVVVEGCLDTWSRLRLHEAVWSALGPAREFVVDLEGVTAADPAGVQGLVGLWRIGVVKRFEHVPAAVRAAVSDDVAGIFDNGQD